MRRHIERRRTRSSPTSPVVRADQRAGAALARVAAAVTDADLSNEAFPFRARGDRIGFARVLCVRITYLGELGYELYIPAEQACTSTTGWSPRASAVGLRHAGLKALASLRMEKGYRDYGHDIDNTDSVLEAGLGFAVDLEKPGGFLGREAVVAKKAGGRCEAARAGPREGSGADAVPRRGRASRRRAGRLHARRVVRPHARRRGGARDGRGRRTQNRTPAWLEAGDVDSGDRAET